MESLVLARHLATHGICGMNFNSGLPRLERARGDELPRTVKLYPLANSNPLADSSHDQGARVRTGLYWPNLVARYLGGVVLNLLEAMRRFHRDDAGLLAACVAFYATLSLFPLLMVLIAGLGLFLRFTRMGRSAEEFVLIAIAQETTDEVAVQVNGAFQQIEQQALLNGPLGALGLLAAALAVFAQFEKAFDKIWNIPKPTSDSYLVTAKRLVSERVKAFAVLLSMGGVVLLIFFAGITLDAVIKFSGELFPAVHEVWYIAKFAEVVAVVVLNALVFTAIFRWLSKIPVGWMHAARGGLLAAITWEVGRLLLAEVFISTNYNAYGVVGALLAAMLWSYYASSVLFLGAEYVQVIREHHWQHRREAAFQQALARQRLRPVKSPSPKPAFTRWTEQARARRVA